ncbi:MAG: glutaminyl-peptide cyclotransferase, partial [Bacteroidia bacterium]
MRFKIFTLVLFSVGLYACGSKNGAQNTNNQPKRLIKLVSPSNNSTVIKGNSIKVELNIKPNANLKIDSVIWTLGKTTKGRLNIDNPTENISTQNLSVGKNKLFVKAYKSDGTQENKFAQIKILSNIEPKLYGYKVIREYPHNNTFYTQGLLVNNNILYESTGQRGMSKLLKYDLESKSVINEYDLPKSFFGEGLAFLNDKLYQITWTSGQGFV